MIFKEGHFIIMIMIRIKIALSIFLVYLGMLWSRVDCTNIPKKNFQVSWCRVYFINLKYTIIFFMCENWMIIDKSDWLTPCCATSHPNITCSLTHWIWGMGKKIGWGADDNILLLQNFCQVLGNGDVLSWVHKVLGMSLHVKETMGYE